jgi:hypothetical protein
MLLSKRVASARANNRWLSQFSHHNGVGMMDIRFIKRKVVVLCLSTLIYTTITIAQNVPTPSTTIRSPNGEVNTVFSHGDNLYVGGRFTAWGAYNGGYAAVDTETGAILPGFPAFTNPTSIINDGSNGWYVANIPITYKPGKQRPTTISHLRSTGAIEYVVELDIQPKDTSVVGSITINAMLVQGDTLIIGGEFASVNGKPRFNLAAVSTSTWQLLNWNPDWRPDTVGHVNSIVRSGKYLIISGAYGFIGQSHSKDIVRINASTGMIDDWSMPLPSLFYEQGAGKIIASNGVFYTAVGAINVETGAQTDWKPVPDTAPGDPYFFARIISLDIADGVIYVAGEFNRMNGQIRHSIAAFSESTGELLEWNPNAEWKPEPEIFYAAIRSIKVSNGVVYAGGEFRRFGTSAATGLAAVNAATGEVLEWSPYCLPWKDPYVKGNRITGVGHGVVFVQSIHASVGEQVVLREGFAELDARTGAVTSWDPGITSITRDTISPNTIFGYTPVVRANAFAVNGTTLYVGGMFDSVQGQPRARLAAFDLNTNTLLPWNPSVVGRNVTRLVYAYGVVYAAGYFSAVGGVQRRFIAAIDATSGETLSWNPDIDSSVTDLAVAGERVYLGGVFSRAGGKERNGFAVVDAVNGLALEEGPLLPEQAQVTSLAVVDTVIYLSGYMLGPDVTPPSLAHSFAPGFGGFNALSGEVVWRPQFSGKRKAIVGAAMKRHNTGFFVAGTMYEQTDTPRVRTSQRSAVMAFDITTGQEVYSEPVILSVQGGMVNTLEVTGDGVYAGGMFSFVENYRMPYFARFNLDEPSSVPVHTASARYSLALYPNPASTSITIHCAGVAPLSTIRISDALGRIVLQENVTGEQYTLSTANMAHGVYFVQAGGAMASFVVEH